MKNYQTIVGIDVSKLKLDVTLMQDALANQHHHFVVTNNEKGLKQMIKVIKAKKIELTTCLFCLENTGVYSMPVSFYLSNLKLEYWVVPALEIRRSKGIVRGKTDKIDSKDIAFYAHTHQHKLQLTELPEQAILKLKLLFTEREKLMRAIKLLDTTKENQSFLPKEILKETLSVNRKVLTLLKKSLKEIETKMMEIIKQNQTMKNQFDLACSVPGVGPQTATYLIITTKSFTAFSNWRKLACYSGIAPFEYSSGTSIRGKTRVNDMADKKMKSMLNMCALNCKRVDTEINQYYTRKVEEGKNPMSVMNAIRCKVISRVFATINRGTPYVDCKKYLN
nr:IS110 family transposase [Bacteroidota bacterium]